MNLSFDQRLENTYHKQSSAWSMKDWNSLQSSTIDDYCFSTPPILTLLYNRSCLALSVGG